MVRLFFFLILLLTKLNTSACESPLTFHIGVVPWAPAAMNQIWAARLNKHLNQHCIQATFGSAASFKEFLNKTIKGEFDLANLPPHMASYLILHHGMSAIAIEDWDAHLIFITQSTSHINALQDLRGQSVVMPDPLSLVSFIALPKVSELTSKIDYVSDHHMVLKSILEKQYQVGVMVSPMLKSLESVVQGKVKIIHQENQQLPGVLVSTHPPKHLDAHKLMSALSKFDLGNDRIWQKWQPASPEKIKQLHAEQAHHVKRLLKEGWPR